MHEAISPFLDYQIVTVQNQKSTTEIIQTHGDWMIYLSFNNGSLEKSWGNGVFLELNENAGSNYILQKSVKSVLRRKFIALGAVLANFMST